MRRVFSKTQETPSSLAVVGSEDGPSSGSSELLQASNSNGRISARAKTPRKRRGVLISIRSLFVGSRCDGAARSKDSMGREDYLPRHPAWWNLSRAERY